MGNETVIDQWLPLGLAFIMLSLGMGLERADFQRVLQRKKAVFIGLISQVVVLPVGAFLLVALWSLEPILSLGLLIIAASPGGVTSNLMTRLAGGDAALSITLTALVSLCTALTLPLVMGLGLVWYSIEAEVTPALVAPMVLKIFIVTTVPVLLGMWIRHSLVRVREQAVRLAHRLATLCFFLIVIATFYTQWEQILLHFGTVGLLAFQLNLLVMGIGFLAATLSRLSRSERIAITLECGVQNAAVGLFMATLLHNSETLMIPSLIYAVVMNGTAGLYIVWQRIRGG